MPDVSFVNVLIVAAVAVAAPLLVNLIPRLRVPSAVVEILAGVLLGPSLLGWVEVDVPVGVLALLGLAFLLFLAGLEIDFRGLRGPVLELAGLGYLLTVVLGLGVGAGLAVVGWTDSALLVAIALSATSLGLVVAVLKDAGHEHTETGQATIAGGTVADFAAIVLLTLFFSGPGRGTGSTLIMIALFAGMVAILAVALSRARRSLRVTGLLARLQDTTAQIRVRMSVLLLVGLVALAEGFGLEAILGAFLAGALVGVLDRDTASHPRFRVKLEALGYGFLIPAFFVASGVRLDLRGLLGEPAALVQVPIIASALLVVRGLPALLYVRRIGRRAAVTAGLLQATSLPFLVTASAIGVEAAVISPSTAASLVCAGLLSVLIFPAVAVPRLPRSTASTAASATPTARSPVDVW